MSFHCGQFRNLIRKTLVDNKLWSQAAENLLLGTAAQESAFGTYLRQLHGPAQGVFQMEPDTLKWLIEKYGTTYPDIIDMEPQDLQEDLYLAILTARLRYRAIPEPLPPAGDLDGLARYYKKYYNTDAGAGTVEQFIKNYRKYVKEV